MLFQKGSRRFERLKEVQEGSRCFKKVQDVSRMCKKVQEGAIRLKKVQEGSWWFNMVQEDPGRVKIVQMLINMLLDYHKYTMVMYEGHLMQWRKVKEDLRRFKMVQECSIMSFKDQKGLRRSMNIHEGSQEGPWSFLKVQEGFKKIQKVQRRIKKG